MRQLTLTDYGLESLKGELERASTVRIVSETICVTFKSPDGFVHYWTIRDIESITDLDKEIEDTIYYAQQRLKKGFFKAISRKKELPGDGARRKNKSWEKAWNEIRPTMSVEVTDKINEFMDLKDNIHLLKESIKLQEDIYNRLKKPRQKELEKDLTKIVKSVEELHTGLEAVKYAIEESRNVFTKERAEELHAKFREGFKDVPVKDLPKLPEVDRRIETNIEVIDKVVEPRGRRGVKLYRQRDIYDDVLELFRKPKSSPEVARELHERGIRTEASLSTVARDVRRMNLAIKGYTEPIIIKGKRKFKLTKKGEEILKKLRAE